MKFWQQKSYLSALWNTAFLPKVPHYWQPSVCKLNKKFFINAKQLLKKCLKKMLRIWQKYNWYYDLPCLQCLLCIKFNKLIWEPQGWTTSGYLCIYQVVALNMAANWVANGDVYSQLKNFFELYPRLRGRLYIFQKQPCEIYILILPTWLLTFIS